MENNIWSCLEQELIKEEKILRKLKLSMIDNVSLTRNMSFVSRTVASVHTVVLQDIYLGMADWKVLDEQLSKKEKILAKLELSQILGVDEETVQSIARCISKVQQVRLTSFCSLSIFWAALSVAFEAEDIQLKILELVSISVDEDSAEAFGACVTKVAEVKMEKMKMKNSWMILIDNLSCDKVLLEKLYLTECWPEDTVVDELKKLNKFIFKQSDDEFTLNNNCIVLTRKSE